MLNHHYDVFSESTPKYGTAGQRSARCKKKKRVDVYHQAAVNKEIEQIDADAVARAAHQTSSDDHHVFINNLISIQSRMWLYCSVFMMHINKVEASAFRLSAVNCMSKPLKIAR